MKVKLQQVSPNPEAQIVEIARVSSSRKDKTTEISKLIGYLIKNNHWSPFEHAFMTVEITTSRGIAAQLLRHRSFTFQEFSQRYQNVGHIDTQDSVFEELELRKAGATNRQSSLEVFDPIVKVPSPYTSHPHHRTKAKNLILAHFKASLDVYNALVDAGVALECARFVLPLATKSKIYMTGTVRSWIHFLAARDDDHAQKEVRLIAKEIKKLFIDNFPETSKALGYGEILESKKDKEVFFQEISNPQAPNKKLKQAVEKYKEKTLKTYVRLNDKQKKALRIDAKKLSLKQLIDKYNVSRRTIGRILN